MLGESLSSLLKSRAEWGQLRFATSLSGVGADSELYPSPSCDLWIGSGLRFTLLRVSSRGGEYGCGWVLSARFNAFVEVIKFHKLKVDGISDVGDCWRFTLLRAMKK
jgi:hypothetical protein